MLNLARLSQHPLLAPYFEAVNPFFWPVLIWQLMRMAREVTAAGRRGALIRISWWGGVRIEYLGDPQPDPSAYRPLTPQRKAWDDPIWATALPTLLNADEPHRLIFPCASGGSGRSRSGLTKGAYAFSPMPDTS